MHAQVKCVRHSKKKKNKKEIPADEPQTHTLIGWILNTHTTITANTPYTDKPATIIQIQNSLTIFVSFLSGSRRFGTRDYWGLSHSKALSRRRRRYGMDGSWSTVPDAMDKKA